eukprot:scaffold7052_cov254-Pinguiococcus_pyrenoidosus.AAC.71
MSSEERPQKIRRKSVSWDSDQKSAEAEKEATDSEEPKPAKARHQSHSPFDFSDWHVGQRCVAVAHVGKICPQSADGRRQCADDTWRVQDRGGREAPREADWSAPAL